MVYSPGPASPVTMGDRNGGLYGRTNRSVSPGTAAAGAAAAGSMAAGSNSNSAPQSKRDKRRTQLQERLYDLTVTFNQNRDSQFRQQLHGLQCDMTLINNADPYEAGPLPDSAEEIAQLIETTVGGGQFGKEMASISGGWYSKFVQEINELKEDRDVELVAVMNRYREAVKRYNHEFSWRQRFAREEFRLLSSTLRERLVQKVSANKTRLMREKEQMDISDTNALLLNPNQFTIAHPSSPGGIHGNRKTRHTRHRIGIDEFGNGIGMEANRRKRKAPDDDVGSPARDAGLSTPADRTKAAAEKQQTDKVYSINSLFTDKELALHANQAHIATAHFFSTSRNQDGVGSALNGGNGDEMDDADSTAAALDDGGTPAATDMGRTASQSYHATRSTRNQGNTGLNLLAELSDKPATRPNLPYHILANHNSRTNQNAPPLNSLMNEEIDDDLSRMDRLQAKPHGWIDRGLIDTITELVRDDVDGPIAANGDRFSLLHAEFPIEMGIKWYSKSNAGSYEMFPRTSESSGVVSGNKRRT